MKKSVKNIKSFFDVAGAVKQLQVVYAVDETCTNDRLKSNPRGEVMLVAYPRFARSGKQDNPNYQAAIAFWIMEKRKTGNTANDTEDDTYDRLLEKTLDVLEWMENMASEQPCSFAGQIKFETIEITPEYNTFGGYNGWFIEMII